MSAPDVELDALQAKIDTARERYLEMAARYQAIENTRVAAQQLVAETFRELQFAEEAFRQLQQARRPAPLPADHEYEKNPDGRLTDAGMERACKNIVLAMPYSRSAANFRGEWVRSLDEGGSLLALIRHESVGGAMGVYSAHIRKLEDGGKFVASEPQSHATYEYEHYASNEEIAKRWAANRKAQDEAAAIGG